MSGNYENIESSRTTPRVSPSPEDSTSVLSPRTPTFPSAESPLLPHTSPDGSRTPTRSFSQANSFVSSPLNPNLASPYGTGVRSRPASRGSMHLSRIASEESQTLGSQFAGGGQRGSMILYRLALDDENGGLLPPRPFSNANRDSMMSTTESIWSLSSDSKYPSGSIPTQRGLLVPYAYDPATDEKEPMDAEDHLHEPDAPDKPASFALRGILNIGVLVIVIAALLTLFIGYPVISFVHDQTRDVFVSNLANASDPMQNRNPKFYMPQIIDVDTPDDAKTRKGFDGEDYVLVFSDEFNIDGRTFYPGDDPYWEAVDLWYGSTHDLEWYDPRQVSTGGGKLRIKMEQQETNGLQFRSGMLQSWNKFCFTSGYIEIAATLPGPNEGAKGYWPGAWTMGNLGRPGYGASTDGTWPYSYNSCDVGTFPNQTLKDGSGPAAALHSDQSKDDYNFELSWLSGQRLSACTCPGEDHPGPDVSVGRGAPEIDIFEAEHNKTGGTNGIISTSSQYAPFSADYLYQNDTTDKWIVYNGAITQANNYHGSAVQQAVSALTALPPDVFEGSGQVFHKFGFETFSDPADPGGGFTTWAMDGTALARVGAGAVGPDAATGVGQRTISTEPMSIVFNLGMANNWQTPDFTTLSFPTEFLIDYVRVYQRKSNQNFGCDPKDFPTMDYINRHLDAYTNAQLTSWRGTQEVGGAGYNWPKNSAYDGC